MGNEGSIPVSYGRKLLNNAKVDWIKVEDNDLAARDGHCSASVGSKLFVFGGVRWEEAIGEVSESNETIVFDTNDQKWSMATVSGCVPSSRCAATMSSVDKNLYVFGGLSQQSGWLNDLYVLDTDTLQWNQVEEIGNCPSPRDKLCSVSIGSKIYVFGGFGPKAESEACSEEAEFQWFNDLYSFDTETCIWKKLSTSSDGSPTPRAAHGMCAIDNQLVIFGGRDNISRQHDVYILNLEMLAWESFKTSGRQPEPRSFHTCVAVGKRMVVFGGRGIQEQHFNDIHVFDIDKKEWFQPSVHGDIPLARGLHTLNVVNENIVVYGGSSAYDNDTMQLMEYHNDTFLIKKEQLLEGESLGPDPDDNPESMATLIPTQLPTTSLGTIKECDEQKGLQEDFSVEYFNIR